MLAQITPTADYAALKDCDLVIEAVFEDRKVKADVIAKIQVVIGDNVIFASNTSTLPITSLATEFKDPARFIGIHFFSPVDRMMLIEIILGKKTGDKALAVALDYVRAIRKTPIVVNDSRGFYANRCVIKYRAREGHLMLLEGMPPAMIENDGAHGRHAGRSARAQRRNGGRSRPEDRARHRGRSRADGHHPREKELLEEMVGRTRPLRSQERQGLLRLPATGAEAAVAGTCRFACRRHSTRDEVETIDVEELKHRFLVVQAVEAARSFEEQVVTDVREADVGSILGWGFAPFSGGTLSCIDVMGTKTFVELAASSKRNTGPALRRRKLLVDWRARTKPSTAASRRASASRRPDAA